jgi:molecular chaperone DnaK
MGRAIGIDLGTTNSCAAIIENNKPRLITYRNGQKTIPSVFAIDKNGNRLVGEDAKKHGFDDPAQMVAGSKRLIGRQFGSKQMEAVKQVFTYELVEGEQSEVLIKVKDQVFTLEQISAAVLRHIKENAEDALDTEVDQAVITVPAYFNDRQRQAVRSAGKLAGLKVLRVLNEPTAAALAYGLGRTLNQRVGIYDLGGGTFDISIIDIKDKIFEVIATGGDTFLGGVDFDDRLMQYVLSAVADSTGADLSYDRYAVNLIRDASESAKIKLSSVDETRIQLMEVAKDDDGEPVHVDLVITRAKLEELTEDLVERSIQTVDRILKEARTGKDQLDEMLLVGGQSRMPLVRRRLAEFIGKPPSEKVHPDEAVAIGAAIMAHSLSSKAGSQDMTLLDVLPMAIGINKVDGTMHVLFQKNSPLPDYKTRTLTTSKDDQRSIMLRIYQGESKYVAENEMLGTFVFSGIREAPKGEVKVEVTFHIDSEGILNLTARDRDTGQLVESRLKLGGDDSEGGGSTRKKKKKKKGEESEGVAPPPMPLSMPGASLSAKPSIGRPSDDEEDEPGDGASTMQEEEEAKGLVKEGGKAAPSAAKAASGASTPQLPAAAPPQLGFFARLIAWFKGLFGGGK